MEVIYLGTTLDDIKFWKKSGNKQIQKKISELIEDIKKHPETGLGKPEQLKYRYSGYWSRRIDNENRIIYRVCNGFLEVLSLRGHY